MSGAPDLARLVRREQFVSAAINTALSALFFFLVFGRTGAAIALAGEGGFAFDFLPQGAMVSLMGALVPSLVVRAGLRKAGVPVPAGRAVARAVGVALACGLGSAALLAGLCLAGPWSGIGRGVALAVKLAYGGALGFLVTRTVLLALFARKDIA